MNNKQSILISRSIMNSRFFSLVFILLLLALTGVVLFEKRPVPRVVRTNLENLPMKIGGYTGVKDSFPDSVYKELNADKHVYRHYTDQSGNQVSLYIGYYGTAKGGRTPHNPYACLPSAGWAILDSGLTSVTVAGAGHSSVSKIYKVNYILAGKDDMYETVFHWYQSDHDKVLATGIQQNLLRFWGRVVHNRNDGAFVRVTALTSKGKIAEAKARSKRFAEMILALLPKYWPEER